MLPGTPHLHLAIWSRHAVPAAPHPDHYYYYKSQTGWWVPPNKDEGTTGYHQVPPGTTATQNGYHRSTGTTGYHRVPLCTKHKENGYHRVPPPHKTCTNGVPAGTTMRKTQRKAQPFGVHNYFSHPLQFHVATLLWFVQPFGVHNYFSHPLQFHIVLPCFGSCNHLVFTTIFLTPFNSI